MLPQAGLDKLKILTNFVSPTVFDFISDCTTYESAKETLIKIMLIHPMKCFLDTYKQRENNNQMKHEMNFHSLLRY